MGELHFCLLCPPCTALDHTSSLSRKLAYVPGPTFGFVKLLASSGSHCTKRADEQHRQAGFESRLVPELPPPFIPTLIGLRAFDLVSSRVWWEAATNTAPGHVSSPGPVLDFGLECGPGKGTMADLGPLIRHLVSTRLLSGGRGAFLSPLSPLYGTRPFVYLKPQTGIRARTHIWVCETAFLIRLTLH